MSANFLSAVGKTLSTGLAIQALSAISGVLIARVVGPEGRGVYAAALMFPLLVSSIVGFGFAPYIARRVALVTPEEVHVIKRQSVVLSIYQTVGGWLLITLLFLMGWPKNELARDLSLLFGLLWLPLNQMTIMLTCVDQGRQDWNAYNVTRFCIFPINLVILLALWMADFLDVKSALLAQVMANVFAVALRFKDFDLLSTLGVFRSIDIRAAIQGGFPFATVTVTALLLSQADVLLATTLLTAHEAGLYVVALAIAQLLGPVSRSVGQVLFSHAAKSKFETRSFTDASQFTLRVLILALAFLIISLVIYCVLSPLITTVYGGRFVAAVPIAACMLPGGFSIAMCALLEEHLKGLGRPALATVCIWLAIGVYAVAGIQAMRDFGAVGLALVFSSAQGVRLLGLIVANVLLGELKFANAIAALLTSVRKTTR